MSVLLHAKIPAPPKPKYAYRDVARFCRVFAYLHLHETRVTWAGLAIIAKACGLVRGPVLVLAAQCVELLPYNQRYLVTSSSGRARDGWYCGLPILGDAHIPALIEEVDQLPTDEVELLATTVQERSWRRRYSLQGQYSVAFYVLREFSNMGKQKGGGNGKTSCKADKTHDVKKSEMAAKQRRWARGEFLKGEEHEQMKYQVEKDERDAVARGKANMDKAFKDSCTNLESLIVLGDPHEEDLRAALRTHLDFAPNNFDLSEAGRCILRRYMELRATIVTAKKKAEEFRMQKALAADLERKQALQAERAARAKQNAVVGARCDAATERQVEEALAEVGGLMAFADL